jgi:hypothetical protein
MTIFSKVSYGLWITIDRGVVSAGWFLTKNIMLKTERDGAGSLDCLLKDTGSVDNQLKVEYAFELAG